MGNSAKVQKKYTPSNFSRFLLFHFSTLRIVMYQRLNIIAIKLAAAV